MVFNQNPAPELSVSWVNSEDVDLAGRNLVYFWNSSCPSCIERARDLEPHHGDGLTVIGVHSPERGFENIDHLERIVREKGLDHPVGHDERRKVWEDYHNFEGPRLFLIEEGVVRAQSGPEGELDDIEEALGKQLEISDHRGRHRTLGDESDIGNRKIPAGASKVFQPPAHRRKEKIHLAGEWAQEKEFIESSKDSRLFLHEEGEIHVVAEAKGIRDIEVSLGGEPVPEEKAGEDLRIEGERSYLRLKDPGVKELVKDVDDEVEIRPEKKVRLYGLYTR
ncbi:MAG: peroxiredoxin family protein [Candidatus Nanohaloarchaea archaeon]